MIPFRFLSGYEQTERTLTTDNNFYPSNFKSLSLRAEDGNGEVIVGVRRLNSFVSPTQSYTLSPPSLHHPNYSPSLASKQHQNNNGHQRHSVQRQPSSGSTSGGSVHHHPHNSSHQRHHHQQHKRSESQDSSYALPVAITTVTSAVGMRRNSPISLTVVNEVMIVPHCQPTESSEKFLLDLHTHPLFFLWFVFVLFV